MVIIYCRNGFHATINIQTFQCSNQCHYSAGLLNCRIFRNYVINKSLYYNNCGHWPNTKCRNIHRFACTMYTVCICFGTLIQYLTVTPAAWAALAPLSLSRSLSLCAQFHAYILHSCLAGYILSVTIDHLFCVNNVSINTCWHIFQCTQ